MIAQLKNEIYQTREENAQYSERILNGNFSKLETTKSKSGMDDAQSTDFVNYVQQQDGIILAGNAKTTILSRRS